MRAFENKYIKKIAICTFLYGHLKACINLQIVKI